MLNNFSTSCTGWDESESGRVRLGLSYISFNLNDTHLAIPQIYLLLQQFSLHYSGLFP